jgi:hypothetical protein
MPALQEQQHDGREAPSTFRLDVQLHDLLTKSPAPRPVLLPGNRNCWRKMTITNRILPWLAPASGAGLPPLFSER